MQKLKHYLAIVGLILLAAGAQPAASAIWNWSTTAGTNATADPTINWSEGMSPSSVNDSARAMMAAIAAWRNDISGVNTTGGTSTAYTLTTSEGVNTTPATGQMVGFIANATNGANATLQVDGGNTYPIFLNGAAIGAGTMVAGSPYRVSFNGTQWLLEGGYGNPYNIPLGGLLYSTLPTPPNSSFVVPAGQCISTSTYSAYWVALGSPASGGCAGGQFAIIDHRGRTPTPLDNIGGSAANRLTSATSGCGTAFTTMGVSCSNGTEGKTLTTAQIPAHSHGVTDPGHFHTYSQALFPGSNMTTGGGWAATGQSANTDTKTTGITIQNTGGGAAHSTLDPNIGLFAYLRVL